MRRGFRFAAFVVVLWAFAAVVDAQQAGGSHPTHGVGRGVSAAASGVAPVAGTGSVHITSGASHGSIIGGGSGGAVAGAVRPTTGHLQTKNSVSATAAGAAPNANASGAQFVVGLNNALVPVVKRPPVVVPPELEETISRLQQYPIRPKEAKTSRFAYVTIHYEGTPNDDKYVLGVRVLLRSIRNTGSKHDMVCIIASNVRESTREYFKREGCIVKEVPNIPNPYKASQERRRTYKPRFEFSFNKLYIWNLLEYERVMFLDADNLFVQNIDELFLCGHFCVVFMNPIYFHTGLMIVRPNYEDFRRLLVNLLTLASYSYDGADQGFLTAEFRELEKAPLFLPSRYVASGAPSELPVMRIPMEYNMNSVYWYPHFSWDFYRRANLVFSHDTVKDPVGTVAFCIGPLFKPWNWLPFIFFHTIRPWHDVRMQLDDSHFEFVVSRLAVAVLIYLAQLHGLRVLRRSHKVDCLRRATYRCTAFSPAKMGYLFGFLCFLSVAGLLIIPLLPQESPASYAWMFITLFGLIGNHALLNLFAALLTPVSAVTGVPDVPPAAAAATAAASAGPSSASASGKEKAEDPLLSSASSSSSSSSSSNGAGAHHAHHVLQLPTGGVLLSDHGNWREALRFAFRIDFFSVMPFHAPTQAASDAAVPLCSPAIVYDDSASAVALKAGLVPVTPANSPHVVLHSASGGGGLSQSGAPSQLQLQQQQLSQQGVLAVIPSAGPDIRHGLSLWVMLLPVCGLCTLYYLSILSTWHYHFVEKIVFSISSVIFMVATFCHLFRRVAEVACEVPAAKGLVMLRTPPKQAPTPANNV